MKTKFFSRTLLVTAMTATFLSFTSCFDKQNDDLPKGEYPEGEGPSQLDFATTKNVNINLGYETSAGAGAVFNFYAENPLTLSSSGEYILKEGLTPVSGGIVVSGKYHVTENLPSYVKELYAVSNNLFAPTLMYAQVNGNTANFEVVELEAPNQANGPLTKTIADGKLDYYMKKSGQNINVLSYSNNPEMDVNDEGRPRYRVSNNPSGDKIPSEYINKIEANFKEGVKADSKYYKDAVIYLETKAAEVWVSVIGSKASYSNSLSYFYYEGKNPGEKADASLINEVVLFPKAKLSNNSNGLKAGQYVQLMYFDKENKKWITKFPKGTSIGFIFRSNAYSNKKINTSTPMYYSYNAWNPEDVLKQHTIYFNANTEEKPFVCFGFEDMPNEATTNEKAGDGDCNDVMFHVDISPFDAIIPPPEIPEAGDLEATSSSSGIIAFEDQWPKKADYDFNDVVVNYESTVTYLWATYKKDANNEKEEAVDVDPVIVKGIKDVITLSHSSATFQNAFEYKVDINKDWVEKVTINGEDVTNDCEKDGEGFIIKITDDVIKEIGAFTCTPKSYNVNITFKYNKVLDPSLKDKYSYSGFERDKHYTPLKQAYKGVEAPYNPYIWSVSGCEIHLTNYPPTGNADNGFFGQENDYSVPGENKYYVGPANQPYPFAIHLAGVTNFTIPGEGVSIAKTYSNYDNWVLGGANTVENNPYANWYENK